MRVDTERGYARHFYAEDWAILTEIRESGKFPLKPDNEQAFRKLLNSRAILQYVNKHEWYGLNPMVRDLTPPSSRIVKP